jgi:hypothetical protein
MMTLMPMYTAQWEMKLLREAEQRGQAEQARLSRMFWSASGSSRRKEHSWPEKSALRWLVTSLGHAGA